MSIKTRESQETDRDFEQKKESTPSLRSLALRGSAWTLGGYGFGQVLRLASSLILTRLLLPDAFGLSALIGTFLIGLHMFSEMGIQQSIIRDPRGDDPDFLNTAWTIQVLRGFGLWMGTFLISRPVAALYDEPLLIWMLPVAGITTLIQGFDSIRIHSHGRHLRLGGPTLIGLLYPITTLSVSSIVALTIPDAGAWALIAGGIAGVLVRTVFSHVLLTGHRHRLRWDRQAYLSLFIFGRWITITTILMFFGMQADRLVLGRLVSMEVLGVYAIALTLASVPRDLSQHLTASVFYPVASRSLDTGGESKVFRARWILLAFSALLCAGMIGAAPAAVGVLYDDRYAGAGSLAGMLVFGAWLQVISATYNAMLMARGAPKHQALGMALKIAIFVSLALPVFQQFGIIGIAGLVALSELGPVVICAYESFRLGLASWRIDLGLTVALVCVAALTGQVITWTSITAGNELAGLALVGISACAGLAIAAYVYFYTFWKQSNTIPAGSGCPSE